jgi:hypothetical protein
MMASNHFVMNADIDARDSEFVSEASFMEQLEVGSLELQLLH